MSLGAEPEDNAPRADNEGTTRSSYGVVVSMDASGSGFDMTTGGQCDATGRASESVAQFASTTVSAYETKMNEVQSTMDQL